jgi:hypothetical protein
MRWTKLSPCEVDFLLDVLQGLTSESWSLLDEKDQAIELLEAAREAAEDEKIPEELR